MSKMRTITLTNRQPVKINEDNWPVLAQAKEKKWDNTYESQANQTWNWSIRVRQHEDGRAIVYATYEHTTNWQGARGTEDKQGDYLSHKGVTHDEICRAIINVCNRMEGEGWEKLADACIADMPAEELDAEKSDQATCDHNWCGGYCDLCGAVKPQ